MKRSIKLSTLLLGMIFLFAQCEKEPFTTLEDPDAVNSMDAVKTSEAECVVVQTLWAGAGQNNTENGSAAGAVTATVVGNMLYVEYSVNMSYYLTEAHLWVGKDKKKVPKNAAPGRFPFKKNLDFASGTTFEVNLTSLGINPGDPVYVAAHGVVVGGIEGVEGLTSLFPVDGTPINYMPVYFKNFPNPTSYFKSIVNDRVLEGTYEGWCVDSRTRINHGTSLNGTVYLSYNLPTGEDAIFQKQENIGMLNWLINYDFVGKESSSFGIFTFGDVQKAIWILLEETPNPNPAGGVGSFNGSCQ
jgi:hypothetical protein